MAIPFHMQAEADKRRAYRSVAPALSAYRAVRFSPVFGGSLAYFLEKEARRADVLAAVSEAREALELSHRRAA